MSRIRCCAVAKRVSKASEGEGPYEKFNFRLNLANPKEQRIWEFLQSHASSREASRVAKQILYEGFTGRSWLTDRPLQNSLSTPSASDGQPEPAILYNEQDLQDLETGLGDWWSQEAS